MTEIITISGTTRKEKYASLLPQLKSLAYEHDKYAAMGNIISALKYGMDFFWAGLYIVKNKGKGEKINTEPDTPFNIPIQAVDQIGHDFELVLGPFQGPVACTRIGYGKGVCGHAWKNEKTMIVDDVTAFEGHIACSTESKSEIVLPIFGKNGEVVMVLDIDSDRIADFSEIDELALEETVRIIEAIINKEC
jgi:L-methionine (R)-S-oxide reductase